MTAFLIAAAVAAGSAGQQGFVPGQFHVDVTLYQGDPLGSRAEGTQKILVELKTMSPSGRSVHARAGGQLAVPTKVSWEGGQARVETTYEAIGTSLEILPVGLANDKVYLEINTSHRVPNPGRGVQTAFGFVPGFNEGQARRSRVLALGEPFTLRLAAESPTEQTWAVVKITRDKP